MKSFEFFSKFFLKLIANSTGIDFVILLVALFELVLFLQLRRFYKESYGYIKEERTEDEEEKVETWLERIFLGIKETKLKTAKKQGDTIKQWYTIFTTVITVFPLLGMLGTVAALFMLDLDKGNMDNIRNNFFMALSSTAWGIICSVFYKILDAVWLSSQIDTLLEKLQKEAEK